MHNFFFLFNNYVHGVSPNYTHIDILLYLHNYTCTRVTIIIITMMFCTFFSKEYYRVAITCCLLLPNCFLDAFSVIHFSAFKGYNLSIIINYTIHVLLHTSCTCVQ